MKRATFIAMLIVLFGCDQLQSDTKAKAEATSPAPSVRADYEYQERCGKAAAQWFKNRYEDGQQITKDSKVLSDFSNHYNKKLNKCFVLTYVTVSFSNGDLVSSRYLNDVNENKEFGQLMQSFGKNDWTSCRVLQFTCTLPEEWEKLVKPYMEE